MHNYILPIIWSFYSYVIGRAFPFVVFFATLVLFWIGGFDFPRAPITAYVILFDIISTSCIRIIVLQSIEYAKQNHRTDFNGKRRNEISDVIGVACGILTIAGVILGVMLNGSIK